MWSLEALRIGLEVGFGQAPSPHADLWHGAGEEFETSNTHTSRRKSLCT